MVGERSGGPPGWSGGPPECPGVVKRPSWISGNGWESYQDVREWSYGPPGLLGVPP